MTSCSISQKVKSWVRPGRSKRDLETQTTYGPQTWQRGLYAQWSIHPPSLVMIGGLCGDNSGRSSRAVYEKHVLFAVLAGCGTEQEKPESFVGFNTTRGKPVLFSVFRSHNCRPHISDFPVSPNQPTRTRWRQFQMSCCMSSKRRLYKYRLDSYERTFDAVLAG